MKRIPMVPFPMDKALSMSKRFRGVGSKLQKMIPSLKKDLYQSELDIGPVEYMSLVFLTAVFYGVLTGSLIAVVTLFTEGPLFLSPIIGLIFFVFGLYFTSFYPKLLARKRIKKLEMNLLFALRHMLIEVRSGVPLFQAMTGVTDGYGEISTEFKKIIREINGGKDQTEALDEAADRNPSLYFRRAIWQLVNAVKGGGDIGNTLEAITDNFAKKQSTEIKNYGEKLNPFTMIYMIVSVIIPSLGITFLIILSSFLGIGIPDILFPAILLGLGLFQFFFMGFIKNKRPAISM
ncbi:MAG: type II secretion system F family protein [Candidatus Aenigmatarchaeota archaeon]